ncbi:hypothetical protein RhiJN_19957 [Ceratobasidium sp. AG-Ba]|nr:hypothetical protein RhiJN_19957 [Ceratobasidium sp. AG-Ba]
MPRCVTRAQARRLNSGFRVDHDVLPQAPVPLEALPSPLDPSTSLLIQPNASSRTRHPYRTEPDIFGRYRVYSTRPQTIPDADAPMAHAPPIASVPSRPKACRSIEDIIAPCPNISVFYVLRYHWLSGNTISDDTHEYLCNEVILQPDFNPRDLMGVDMKSIDNKLAEAEMIWDPNRPLATGWKNVPLRLKVPPPRVTRTTQRPVVDNYIDISGYRARSLVDIMIKAFTRNNTSTFHYEPFEHRWKPTGSPGPAQTLFGEMYTSPAMLRAHREVQDLKIDCTLPRCVGAFMFASDGMQFAQFSHVKGWPILCWFGNESKYERCKPTSNTCFQAAHIPTLPDKVKEEITHMHGGKPPSDQLLTHLRRELMHEIWRALLDDEFIKAWREGVVIECADGVVRRVFPRILTYSADYPEKVLLATIRNGGDCLCPRCFVHKASASQMGTPSDMRTRKKRRIDNEKRRGKVKNARRFIYEPGSAIQSKPVEALLKSESYVPTLNAFSDRLHEFKFNIFSALVVDQLHEVELGVWKSLFQHLVRLLHHQGPRAVSEFNRFALSQPLTQLSEYLLRMWRTWAESRDMIMKTSSRHVPLFLVISHTNTTRQCCMPVFEGLLPESCDKPAQTLLFIFAEWHGLVKLRLHTSASLKVLKSLTTRLGTALRNFAKITAKLEVRETPKEYACRKKKAEANKASLMVRQSLTSKSTRASKAKNMGEEPKDDGRRICTLNLNTYKTHSCGDVSSTIEEFGTTDSYSTQIGELHNRIPKSQYNRTNKRNAVEQMTRINNIQEHLREAEKELQEARNDPKRRFWDHDEAVSSLVDGRPYFIGQKERSEDTVSNIAAWVSDQHAEPSVKFFLLQLKQHLLGRVLGTPDRQEFTTTDLAKIDFYKQRMYRHKTLRINYTSYDVLRQQDILNPSTPNCFVVLANAPDREPDEHPFIYAKVLGVYHTNVIYAGRPPRRMDFVHVRWMYYDENRPGGWKLNRLDRLAYQGCNVDTDILDAFGFVDPSNIVRATHLIPDFVSGTTKAYLNIPLSVSHDDAVYGDWNGYYVNRFVDRDMLMRYVGGGVGHYRQNASAVAINADEIIEESDLEENHIMEDDDMENQDLDDELELALELNSDEEEGGDEPGFSDDEIELAGTNWIDDDDLYGF